MKVKYTGTADFQEFSAADFKKAGVEGKKVSFPRGEAVEVSDEVGQALVSDEGLFGGHSFEEVNDEEEQADDGEANRADAGSEDAGQEMTESGTPQQGTDAPARATAKKTTSARTR